LGTWIEVLQGNLTEEEYKWTFSMRKARFVVYNNSKLTIEASIHINAQLHERELYSTVLENLKKIRETWILCGRPNSEDKNNNSRRARALMKATSLRHMIFRPKDKVKLKQLTKRMVDYTYHAWQ
jgi:hypothetical protein